MLRLIDRRLNGITMYRVVLYGLMALSAAAIVLAFAGFISYSGTDLLLALLLLTATCFVVNMLCARLWKVPANSESWLITALILFLILFPLESTRDALMLALAGTIAMASKYVLAYRGKHIFNPAALTAVMLGVLNLAGPLWWIGTPWMLPFTLIVGLLIVRKVRRFPLFLSCVGASVVTVVLLGLTTDIGAWDILRQHFLSWPIIFYASVMVTEPLTLPPRRYQQMIYGAIIGVFSSWPLHVAHIYSTPELVLVLANLYSYVVSLHRRLILTMKEKNVLARDTYEFVFALDPPLSFLPGQYLEWTLPHPKTDDRGVRRYFTIASSPTEKDLRLGVKIGEKASSFKTALRDMQPGDTILAGQIAGDFLLTPDPAEKLVFIAGGIGITPFRSMIKNLIDRNERRDIILLYFNRTEEDIAYRPLLTEAEAIGVKTVYLTSERPIALDDAFLTQHVPDIRERHAYLSGPNAMVDAYKAALLKAGVERTHIKTDYFPGFA